jgi:hypothetical protein
MHHHFDGILGRIYQFSEKFFIIAHIGICQNAPRPLTVIIGVKKKKNFCENVAKKWVSNPASEFAIEFAPRLNPQKNIIRTVTAFTNTTVATCGRSRMKGILDERILEHRRDESSAIYQHYKYCDHYDKKVRDKYKVDPEYLPQTLQREIFESQFKILEKKPLSQGFSRNFPELTYNP